jgi:hypothetical protein
MGVSGAGGVSLTYDWAGNLTELRTGNFVSTDYTYDALTRLKNVKVRKPFGVTIENYALTLGPAGNRTVVQETGTVGTANAGSISVYLDGMFLGTAGGTLAHSPAFHVGNSHFTAAACGPWGSATPRPATSTPR